MKNKETLQDFINEELEDVFFTNIAERKKAERLIEIGANWQGKQRYSEEDMIEYADYSFRASNDNRYVNPLSPSEWFQKYKK
jgi:hypothetical protein